jgi:hypothetical protein
LAACSAIAVCPGAPQDAAVLEAVKDQPFGGALKKRASLTASARGGLGFVHGRGEEWHPGRTRNDLERWR